MNTWYDSSINSNILRKTYVNGFLDVSQNLNVRSNMYVNGDVRFKSTGRVDVCGNFYAQYPDDSIPISAIIGDNENKAKIFALSKNSNGFKDIKITTENLIRGTWEQISYIDGIQSNYSSINLIDKKNQLWIGSFTGLTIYDGQEMRNFTQKDGLPNATVVDIFQDKVDNV